MILIIFVRFAFFVNTRKIDYIHQTGVVIDIKDGLYNSTNTIDFGSIHLNIKSDHKRFMVGDELFIKGKVNDYRGQTIPNGFNAHLYYLSHHVHGFIDLENVEKVDHGFHLKSLRYKLLEDIDDMESAMWIKSFMFGERLGDQDVKSTISNLGMMHLFQVSGLHIYMLVIGIKKVLFYLDIKDKHQKILILLIYIVFFYLHGFDVGSTRLLIMYVLILINDHYELRLSRLDLVQFAFIIMLLWNIHWIYNTGFLILYLILNFIYLLYPMMSDKDSLSKKYILSSMIFLVILPFYNIVSVMTIILLPLMTFLITGPFFYLILLSLCIPELDPITYDVFSTLSDFLKHIESNNITIFLPSLSQFLILLYFVSLIFLFQSRHKIMFMKRLLITIFILFFPIYMNKLDRNTHIYFLDVGQGDSIYIESPGCNILVDAYSNTKQFLVNKGIYSLDYMILTHSDHDHIKEAREIIESIRVKQLLINAFDQNHEHYTILPKTMKANDIIHCKNLELYFLSPGKDYGNPNDNSIVFQLKVADKTILFTGDIEVETEKHLIFNYKEKLKSDIIKVPHHGSSTSSHKAFIDYVKPTYAIISVGEHNKYNFPNDDVIDHYLMLNTKIYRTDHHGTIQYTISKNKEKWSFHLPF
ncbi:MAG: DNA internalization-related competence protein ComEC/Rec2 [Acholeplasmataceae bacterium]|nr:DNA internalization-related competence protein ComEC/Rec2 [Acholeplasmataceae bacterium]